MLLDFTVSNFGPFDEPVTLYMEASAFSDSPEPLIPAGGTKNGILASVSIFGPNASGKSYLFKAVSALKSVVRKKRTQNQPITPYYPFKVAPFADTRPTVFRISSSPSISGLRSTLTSRGITCSYFVVLFCGGSR